MHVYYELLTVLGTYLPTLPPTRAEVRLRTLIEILLSREVSVETSAFRRAGSSVHKRILRNVDYLVGG